MEILATFRKFVNFEKLKKWNKLKIFYKIFKIKTIDITIWQNDFFWKYEFSCNYETETKLAKKN